MKRASSFMRRISPYTHLKAMLTLRAYTKGPSGPCRVFHPLGGVISHPSLTKNLGTFGANSARLLEHLSKMSGYLLGTTIVASCSTEGRVTASPGLNLSRRLTCLPRARQPYQIGRAHVS